MTSSFNYYFLTSIEIVHHIEFRNERKKGIERERFRERERKREGERGRKR
jgi:hypothetical protein